MKLCVTAIVRVHSPVLLQDHSSVAICHHSLGWHCESRQTQDHGEILNRLGAECHRQSREVWKYSVTDWTLCGFQSFHGICWQREECGIITANPHNIKDILKEKDLKPAAALKKIYRWVTKDIKQLNFEASDKLEHPEHHQKYLPL